MSAYMVSLDTIDYLLGAAQKWHVQAHSPLPLDAHLESLAACPVAGVSNYYVLDGRTNWTLMGRILLAQNVRSVNYRYQENEPMPDYTPQPVSTQLIDPVVVLKSLACLEYQSCETDDYEASFARLILQRIEDEAIRHLPGYDAAPWGWERSGKAVR